MSVRILSVIIHSEPDTVAARQRARQIARLLGFGPQDQTRISTAVSEIARNAFNYAGGGQIEYLIEGNVAPQLFLIKVTDSGPGIRDLNSILEGTYDSQTGMGLGITGARRLMDQFQVESDSGRGTTIWLKKLLPKRAPLVRPPDVAALVAALAREAPQDPFQEFQHQSQELLRALEEIRTPQADLIRLNRELEDTNRGMVASTPSWMRKPIIFAGRELKPGLVILDLNMPGMAGFEVLERFKAQALPGTSRW